MTISDERIDKTTVKLTLSGRLDTANAPQLERKIKQWGDDITDIILDFSEMDYVSSMGLRVLLHAYKTMKENNRRLVILNMQEAVREVFELTGFISLMVQEEKFVVVRKEEEGSIVLLFNGEMKLDNIPAVSEELGKILDAKKAEGVKVFLDMENISRISPAAYKQFIPLIANDAWEKGSLIIRNASDNMKAVIKSEDLDYLIEA